jgi:hypothetical protein
MVIKICLRARHPSFIDQKNSQSEEETFQMTNRIRNAAITLATTSIFFTAHSASAQDFNFINFMPNILAATATQKSPLRDYSQPVSATDRNDIRYIVTTLAKGSWTDLLRQKSSLERAGDRVDHVHPLRFLMVMFSSEELKAGAHSIRDRKKIWKNFSEGLFGSLELESNRNNMQIPMLQDFANTLGINLGSILPTIQQRNWSALYDQLLILIPRTGDPGRYGM